MFLYLGGCLTYYSKTNQMDKARYWREEITGFLKDNGVEFFDPLVTFNNLTNHTYSEKLIVSQNKFYLNKTDILIMCTDDILESPGSQWELCFASEVRKIPIITFGEKSWSPHILNSSTQHCDTIKDVIDVLCNMFDQSL